MPMSLDSMPRRMRSRGAGVLLLAVAGLAAPPHAPAAHAQIIRPAAPVREPSVWTSLSVGVMQLEEISDWPTNALWDYGTVFPWRASVEARLSRGTTAGIAGVLSRPGLAVYTDACPGGCRASSNLFQILGLLRVGGGRGFHQVLELQGGVTGYSNFRDRETDGRLPPVQTVWDPTISFGYGFAYTFSPTTSAHVVQDAGLVLHRTGDTAPAGADRTYQWWVTRIGVRYGL